MLTPEQREQHNKLVAKIPCKKCFWYQADSAIKCGHECTYDHDSFKPNSLLKANAYLYNKKRYEILKERKLKNR